MGADTLKKIMLYSAVAVGIGLLLMFVPLVAVVKIRAYNGTNDFLLTPSLSKGLQNLEGTYGLSSPEHLTADFIIFVMSVLVALFVYMWVRRNIPRDYRWVKWFSY